MAGKFECQGLVRDKNGVPRFDDINNIHPMCWAMLSHDEKVIIKQERDKGNKSFNSLKRA